jgi:hypothetical protein
MIPVIQPLGWVAEFFNGVQPMAGRKIKPMPAVYPWLSVPGALAYVYSKDKKDE